jgi:hypothetical protein
LRAGARAKNHEVIQALAADRADHPLHEGILPGRPWGDEDFANPHGLDSPHELVAVDSVTITDQVGWSRIIRERLDKLPGGPRGRRMVGDVEVDEFTAIVAKDDEDEEQAKGEGGNHEEVDRDDLAEMRGEKDAPRGRGPR